MNIYHGMLIFICLFSTGVKADYLTTTLASYHKDREAGYNEFNPGIGYRSGYMTAGAYKNSHDNLSVYLAGEYHYPFKRFSLAIQSGVVSGYTADQLETPSIGDFRLYALPMIVVGKDIQYKIGVFPTKDWIITFQIDFRI